MDILVKLFVSALFSLHQYLPDDENNYKKYFNDVRQATQDDVFPAAHESCRYLIKVLSKEGLDKLTGMGGNKALTKLISDAIGNDETLEQILEILKTDKFLNKFKEKNIDPSALSSMIINVCSSSFSNLKFRPNERQEIYDFIQSEINILTPVHLNSLGDYNYYGSVNLFSRSGEMIGTIDAVPRAWVPYEQMSRTLTLALLSTEDAEFFEHKGVDSSAIARMMSELMGGADDVTGGSTVTMQLLKNLYFLNGPISNTYPELNSGSFSTLLRKVREWYWAWPFEKEHAEVLGDLTAKRYILEMYFNLVDFGPRIQGVQQASYVYFDKSASELNLAQAAFITTLLKSPSRYSNPDNYVLRTEPRRNNTILNAAGRICSEVPTSTSEARSKYKSFELADLYVNMCTLDGKRIGPEDIELAKKEPMPKWNRPQTIAVEPSMILLRKQVSDWLNKYNFDPEKKPKEISVQTTIDQNLQNIVFDVVREKLDEYDNNKDRADLDRQNDRVEPARDDTSLTAMFEISDIGLDVMSVLRSHVDKKSSSEVRYLFSIKYRPANQISSQTLDFIEASTFLMSLDKSESEIIQINDEIENELVKRSKALGEVYIIEIKRDQKRILSFEEFISESKDLDQEQKSNQIFQFQPTAIRNKIIQNSLDRMYRARPRSNMTVGVLNEDRKLVNRDLELITLAQQDINYIAKKRYSFGDFFWLRKDSQSSGDIYYLETPKLQAAVVVMDTNTGEVLANFGSYDPSLSSYNRSRDGGRQAGSTLKPWIYFYALNKGYNPQDIIDNRYGKNGVHFKEPGKSRIYYPKNYDSNLNGFISFFQSLINSQNIGTYNLIQNSTWGPDWIQNLNELQMFLQTIGIYDDSKYELTSILGTKSTSLERLTSSFSFFANGKHIVQPQYIKNITDYKGEVLYHLQTVKKDVPIIKNEAVFQIQTMMAETANRGTAEKINKWTKELFDGKYSQSCYNGVIGEGKQTCFAGKTGTSNDANDVWFIGFSKNFVIGTWIGYEHSLSIGSQSTGGGLAIPIFQSIIEKAEAFLPKIEPIITPEAVPRNLERRIVYGLKACPYGSGESFVIYSDFNSRSSNCVSGNPGTINSAGSRANTNGQNNSRVQDPTALYPNNSCTCLFNPGGYFAVDIFYNNKLYPAKGVYNSKEECEAQKGRIRSTTGIYLCQ